jgi:hypothetical protein
MDFSLNDLLRQKDIDPQHVLVVRHRPVEPKLNKVLLWLAAERHDLFNAYQATQSPKLEKAMMGAKYLASFIGHQPRKALFIGLYSIGGWKSITPEEFWQIPATDEMRKKYDLKGFTNEQGRSSCLWFNLELTEFYSTWKGKLIVDFPPPERAFWRRAHKNNFSVLAILEDSALNPAIPDWRKMVFNWHELEILPMRLKSKLSEWRGIYYILDTCDGKAYVGSAYGDDNLLGRWLNYASTGHGGNALLRERDPEGFRLSILERVSPDMQADDVIRREATWKDRLRTRSPHGLNDN